MPDVSDLTQARVTKLWQKLVTALPADELQRLENAERANRSDARGRGLKAEPVSVLGLWLLQRGRCACGNCEAVELNPTAKHGDADQIVVLHIFPRGAGGGHTIDNVRLGRHDHNQASARQEWKDIAKGRRMTPNYSSTLSEKEERGRRMQGRGFQEPPANTKWDWKKGRRVEI